ncbi:hypothetical protein IV417_10655 [Alphaproteobacteria bacterium KMM 3653]|uniref:Uncharacterized protein n=1 Tax=Harenicola maris TaxID=2841044 RepID=A0AAP2G823_9RHOB|nr:hypothetical protein [Harenicola maris]
MAKFTSDIYAGIDGTGPSDNGVYAEDFKNSHVRTFWKNWHGSRSYYLRGPDADGGDTHVRASAIAKKVISDHATKQGRIILCGYSRGAAAVIQASHELKRAGLKVDVLMLFDAVDRAVGITETVIPSNVAQCFHAMRDPAAKSREIFGNVGTTFEPGVFYQQRKFHCTHGGVGGTPWTTAKANGYISEMDEVSPSKAHLVGSALGPVFGTAAGGAAHALNKNMDTNVTLAQDKSGAEATMTWMAGNLRTGLIAAGEFDLQNASFPSNMG